MRVLCVLLIFLIAVLSFLDRYFYKHNEMFCLSCVIPRWSRCPQLATSGDNHFDPLFLQPYSYLGQGKQSFVFQSKDEKWVLKLCRLPRHTKIGSLKGKKKSLKQLEKLFESFKASYESLREETKVVFAHLRPTTGLCTKIELIDASQHHHVISLDELPFIIQPSGKPFFSVLNTLNENQMKEMIEKTVALYTSLYEKGYMDEDPIFDKNFGIHDGYPFIMDVGQLEPISKKITRHDYLLMMTNSLDIYLREQAPQFYDFYRNLLQ